MKILLHVLCLTMVNIIYSQKVLQAISIDYWPKENQGSVSINKNYNRVSSYLYIINPSKYLEMFDGENYTSDERKLYKINKNDKPNFLQMSISISDQSLSKESLTVPLLLVNLKDKANFKTFESFQGPILDNLNIDNVSKDIMGEIKVKAMISNSTAKFWNEVAKISSDLGKSAIAIAIGSPKGTTDLTLKMREYLDKGITNLEKLSNGERLENYKFFVTLVKRPDDSVVEELVTSVRLYQINWEGNMTQSTNFFSEVGVLDGIKPNALQNKITNTEVPMVLIVETRSRTKIDVGNPVFTDDYKRITMDDYRKYPLEDQPLLTSYYTNFTYAYSAYNYLRNFKFSLDQTSTDWNSLLFAIENTYQFRVNVKKETYKYSTAPFVLYKARFEAVLSRYKIIDQQLKEMYTNFENKNTQLGNADFLLNSLLNPINTNNEVTKESLYNEIKKLAFFDNWIRNISADGSTLKSSSSYQKCNELKGNYETKLYEILCKNLPSNIDAKLGFYSNIKANYEICGYCFKEASSQEIIIKNETLKSLLASYQEQASREFTEFNDCSVYIESNRQSIKSTINSSTYLTQTLSTATLIDLESNLKLWSEVLARDTKTASIEQLSVWSAVLKETNLKMKNNLKDLI